MKNYMISKSRDHDITIDFFLDKSFVKRVAYRHLLSKMRNS